MASTIIDAPASAHSTSSTPAAHGEALGTLTRHIDDLFDVAALLAALNRVGERMLERDDGNELEDGHTITHVSKIGRDLLLATIEKLDAARDQLKASTAPPESHLGWSVSDSDATGVMQ